MNSIHVIGLGVTETPELSQKALQALENADRVIGSARQLKVVETLLQQQQTLELPPLSELALYLESALSQESNRGHTVILASGDPLYYGIGRWLSRHIPPEQLFFYPAVSSIQAACHALGLSLQDVEVISLHGRPMERIRTVLKHRHTLVVLTDKYSTPQVLARECVAAGFEQSKLVVCESMGYENQRLSHFDASELAQSVQLFDPLHITVIETRGDGGVLPEFPGIPDDHFETGTEPGKGMITKREVRLNILSLLQPSNDDVIWDIGAGCGSVAIELAYWNECCQVIAIEQHTERLKHLEKNRRRFGVVSNLSVQPGRAPEILEGLSHPNKVFIGGSDGRLPELLAQTWEMLPPGGVLVASAVTENTRHQFMTFLTQRNLAADAKPETCQIAVSKGGFLSDQLIYRPVLPVTLFRFIKRLANSPDKQSTAQLPDETSIDGQERYEEISDVFVAGRDRAGRG
ncbi:precorrin-6y C5,15-methyltransferase (decarboxylating) subunit CbiE [Hahella ganghwensis]|uniref:precorrin-6y C5,15-methyltransferase (decarboxylating) subunit CbiE n=1 Tax=Hahella ganghwensis TaxID=286420 RepID=UPI000367DCB6|nr:precorrin-6y C5,15-methyltransferase (decarboxylating) subunit CbiE [Hahella ganghwensis]